MGEADVVPEEGRARARCEIEIERFPRHPNLVAEGEAAVARGDDELVRGKRAGIGRVVAEVVVADGDGAVRGDVDRRCERGHGHRGPVDPDRRRPRQPSVGGARERDVVAHAAAEASVTPDDVEVAARRIDGDVWEPGSRAHAPTGVRVADSDRLVRRDVDHLGPRQAFVGGEGEHDAAPRAVIL